MASNNPISLTFRATEDSYCLLNSSLQTSPVDQKIGLLAGRQLKQVIEKASPFSSEKLQSEIRVKLIPDGTNYLMSFENSSSSSQVRLNPNFVRALSGGILSEKTSNKPLPQEKKTFTGFTGLLNFFKLLFAFFSRKDNKKASHIPPTKTASPFDNKSQERKNLIKKTDGDLEPSSSRIMHSKVIGVKNTGADCFMNAVFQVILHDDLLRDTLFKTYEHDLSESAKELITAIKSYTNGNTISTYALRSFMLKDYQKGQQDSSEFLIQLFSKVSRDKHPEIFATLRQTYFIEKETISSNMVTEFIIPLIIPSKTTSLVDGRALIETSFKKVEHKGDPFKDEKTQTKYQLTHAQTTLLSSPKRFIFSLNRFDKEGKVATKVQMPDTFQTDSNTFVLKRVIMHHGSSMHHGHYTALLHSKENEWLHADDILISKTTRQKQDLEDGYIYFYELTS